MQLTIPPRTRVCRKHRGEHSRLDFPLAEDPKAKAAQWATRHWCGPCLVAGGHITEHQLVRHRAAVERQWRKAHAEARRARLTADLASKAKADPVFRQALTAAARKVA